jgi:hypothetical protein
MNTPKRMVIEHAQTDADLWEQGGVGSVLSPWMRS